MYPLDGCTGAVGSLHVVHALTMRLFPRVCSHLQLLSPTCWLPARPACSLLCSALPPVGPGGGRGLALDHPAPPAPSIHAPGPSSFVLLLRPTGPPRLLPHWRLQVQVCRVRRRLRLCRPRHAQCELTLVLEYKADLWGYRIATLGRKRLTLEQRCKGAQQRCPAGATLRWAALRACPPRSAGCGRAWPSAIPPHPLP